MRFLVFLFLMICNWSHLHAQTSDLVSACKQAFGERNIGKLNPWLADTFRLAGGTDMEARNNLSYFLKNNSFDSLNFVNKKNEGSASWLQFELFRKGFAAQKMEVALNEDKKITYIDLADRFFGMNRNQESRLRAVVPFENHCGKMIVALKINNFQEPLRFLFDTGADGMAVSTELAEKIGLKVTRSNNAAIVGGDMQIKVSDNNEIHFGGFSMQRMGIAIFENMDKGVSGILGNAFLRRYITEIDYDKNEIRLYDFGKSAPVSAGHSVDVKVPRGLVLVPVELAITDGKVEKGNFVFDSGASYGLICFRNFVQKHKLLVSGFVSKYVGSTVSMGMATSSFTGIAHHIQIGDIAPGTSSPVTLMAGFRDSDKDLPHDGSLGVRLLSRYNILINLQEGKTFFTPNKLSNLPPDFMIGSYVFGWDNMEVLRVVGGGPDTDKGMVFPEGTEVAFIDKMEPSELIKNKGKRLNKLMASGKPIQMQLRVNGALVTYTGK